jgi:signal transduction histidine kinase
MQGLAPGFNNPYAVSRDTGSLLGAVGGLLFVASFVGAVVSLVRRFRRSSGIVREQLKWLVLAASGVAVTLAIGMPVYLGVQSSSSTYASSGVDIVSVAIAVSILGIPVAMGIAILRYRLWDIDVVINKAVVFGALAAAITAVYVGVVVGIGALVGSTGRPNVGLSVAATAAVAVLIQPLRAWARRFANRLVYGKRATPHDVLTVLGERISEAYSLHDVLPRLARLVTEATAASSAEVWLRVGGDLRPEAAWPHDPPAGITVPINSEEIPTLPGSEHTFPVRHQGELLGVVAVKLPANESLTSADERLLTDLASHAGLVLHNLRLIEELRASRQRLVSAQDAERRKIERNLHDGAQQHLVALAINLRLAQTMLDGDPAQAREMLQQLQGEAGEALENLRDLARGIYPPLLADRGLAAALTSHAAKAPVPTTVEAGVVGRYPMEVEAAVYFCVLEALQNVSKYARASSAVVRVAENNGHLEFAVIDDGAGFDAATATRGAGLTNMTDRIEALGGRIEVTSKLGAGTTIRGFVTSSPVP